MQEFQKLITPGHIAGHRAKAALAPFYAPACVSYTAGIVLALCAFTGVGGHALTMPAWFDRAFTADVAVYQKAADARAAAAQKAAEDKVAAESKAQSAPTVPPHQTSNATQPAAPVVASAPPATPSVPENYTPSPALQEAIQTIGLMTHASTMAAFAQQDEAIAEAMTKLVNADRAISDKASAGFAACAKQSRDFNEKAIADAPDHILRGEAQQAFFDVNRTCISDLLASFATKE